MALYTVIRADGTEENVKTSVRGGALMREVLRAIVADTADTVNLRDGRVMVVDDTGMVDGKATNEKATALYWSVCRPGTIHPICGDVAICLDRDFA